MRPEDIIGKTVKNQKGEDVADIEDVVTKKQGGQKYAVLVIVGFLGIGEEQVASPLSELKMGNQDAILMSPETEEQLEKMPEYNEQEFQPESRTQELGEKTGAKGKNEMKKPGK